MNVSAPAKINLWLTLDPRRPDGYHPIVSVMQAVSLADRVTIEPSDAVTIDVQPPGSAPEDATNLAARAATALRAATGTAAGAALHVHKTIPSGAGLAGGSADAAATLVGANALWNTGLSRKALEKIGARLGADVPFCVRGGTAIARGIGAELSPLACPSTLWWVLASDGSSSPTPDVYAEADRLGVAGCDDPATLADALARGDLDVVARSLRNDLEVPALSLAPATAEVREALEHAGALGVVMSGSGSAWCALARNEGHAREIAASAGAAWTAVAHSVEHGPVLER